MKPEDFPTMIHPFDMYKILNEMDNVVTVLGRNKKETIDIPIILWNPKPQLQYMSKGDVFYINERKFVQTTAVPPITEEGIKMLKAMGI